MKATSRPKPTKRPRREEKKESTRQAILRAALALFAEKGFYTTTTKAISRKAKIAEGTLFNYFQTKEDLALYFFEQELSGVSDWYGRDKRVQNAALPKTSYGAAYFPWIYVSDPLKSGKLRLTPPSGSIAGLFARTDNLRGVWTAPAGTDAAVIGVSGLSYNLTDSENGALNALGINCLRVFPTGTLVWGAQTLEGTEESTSDWKYIPVRRLALFIEESLYREIQWAVFEPNAEPLWAQIRLNVGAFLQQLFCQRAFQGSTPRDAYFVKCDAATTTQNDIDAGLVNVVVGFAPLRRAEFVVLTISTKARRPK